MNAREYLVSKGLAKAGRGKFSNDAKAELQRAMAAGMVFDDYKPTGRVVAQPKPKVEVEKTPVQRAQESTYISPTDFRFPESEYVAVYFEGGKRKTVGMREVCSNCGYSLTNHGCNAPTILGDVAVKIERV
jgi:uncharacterized protein YigE (DUF2233 family)